ncbi:hypothetical protein SAMN05216167_11234 [Spirosoma endophyticum]|uniref:Uncharacterized protein n=2 Tax=Spirosoma endophyticum TaxID=662367 RepID=A0A1I1ZAY0_9BACT|nr:hypothetical protein SAMN05216167_11234 [Spirosoma endophyticum]
MDGKRTKLMNEEKVARGLGWFSIGLGLVEVLAPRPVATFLGTSHPNLIRAFRARELAARLGILLLNKPTAPWLWARVGGDALDMVALALTYQHNPVTRKAVGFSLAKVVAITALDVWCARQLKPYNWPVIPNRLEFDQP